MQLNCRDEKYKAVVKSGSGHSSSGEFLATRFG